MIAGSALLLGDSAFVGEGDRSISLEAAGVAERVREAFAFLRASISIGDPLQQTLDSLSETAADARTKGWDGYAAEPVHPLALAVAREFLAELPADFLPAEAAVDPDGEVSLEWRGRTPSHIFSISFSPSRRISYAGVFGGGRAHGSEYFSDSIPPALLSYIRRATA